MNLNIGNPDGASTVAAISTPLGKGGVALIRISGPDAATVAERIFQPMAKGRRLGDHPPRQAVYGQILSEGQVIDSGIATLFRAPHSFTGEDVAEICCHGGILLTQEVLRAALCAGAEAAGPGEFTKRAFLNGKLGLTEAEGVIDLIEAESRAQLRMATAQSRGLLSRALGATADRIKHLLASVYAYIDYPDEDLTDVSCAEMAEELADIRTSLMRLIDSYRSGRAVKEGVSTVLVGRPNTGKSSLLNAILGQERAIVTDIPGTTRDTVEERAPLGAVMLRLCDTAGIRETDDPVEQMGVARALERMEQAELLLGVLDGSAPLEEEDRAILRRLQEAAAGGQRVLLLLNKSDLPERLSADLLPQELPALRVSARAPDLLARLRGVIEPWFFDGSLSVGDSAILSNARQHAALSGALEAVERAQAALSQGMTQDLAGMDLEIALRLIEESDGRAVIGEVVDTIFGRFCIGK